VNAYGYLLLAMMVTTFAVWSDPSTSLESDEPETEPGINPDCTILPCWPRGWETRPGSPRRKFGEAIHGAGAVRFDTVEESGPAGEGGERIDNFVRLVRDAS
jgi:hypothetical protein